MVNNSWPQAGENIQICVQQIVATPANDWMKSNSMVQTSRIVNLWCGQKSAVGRQKSEVGSQKSDVGRQKSEIKSQKSEFGSLHSRVRSRKSEARSRHSEVRSQKSESRNQTAELRRQNMEYGMSKNPLGGHAQKLTTIKTYGIEEVECSVEL